MRKGREAVRIDTVIEQIKAKRNPCIVGIDPEWEKLPLCYMVLEKELSRAKAVELWARDVIDAVADLVPAIKPQAAFFEVFGAEGFAALEHVVQYAHQKGLFVVDDSKRGDIGNTVRAYAAAHLAPEGPINADFLTVSPFLGMDTLQPFLQAAAQYDKGLFVLVCTSNSGAADVQSADKNGVTVTAWLAAQVDQLGHALRGKSGYSAIGAVVGATFPQEARALRTAMPHSWFLVPGYGAQGGGAQDVVPCFNSDGLGAFVSASRSVLYAYEKAPETGKYRESYKNSVRMQALTMQRDVYAALKRHCPDMAY